MGNYSQEEIRAFKLKDIMNCRMSALKAAATNLEGQGVSKAEVVKQADTFYSWLRQDQDVPDEFDKAREIEQEHNNRQLPVPTQAQKKVIDVIAGTLGLVQADPKLLGNILAWAKEVHGNYGYPTQLSSVDEYINWQHN